MVNSNDNIFFTGLPDFEIEEAEEKRKAKLPKEPSFSLKDMEQARAEAKRQGYDEGLEAAKLSLEQKCEVLIHSIVQKINDFEDEDQKRHDLYIQNSVNVTNKAVTTLMAPLLDHSKIDLLQKSLADFFEGHSHKSQMTLFVHPTMIDPITPYIGMLSPNVVMEPDETLMDSDAKLKWVDGEFKYEPSQMVDHILNILGNYDTSSTDEEQNNNGESNGGLDDSIQTPHNDEDTQTQTTNDIGDMPHE